MADAAGGAQFVQMAIIGIFAASLLSLYAVRGGGLGQRDALSEEQGKIGQETPVPALARPVTVPEVFGFAVRQQTPQWPLAHVGLTMNDPARQVDMLALASTDAPYLGIQLDKDVAPAAFAAMRRGAPPRRRGKVVNYVAPFGGLW